MKEKFASSSSPRNIPIKTPVPPSSEPDEARISRWHVAGAPLRCFVPTCWTPFKESCVHGNDGHYYCSQGCADQARGLDLSRIEELRSKRGEAETRPSRLPAKKYFWS